MWNVEEKIYWDFKKRKTMVALHEYRSQKQSMFKGATGVINLVLGKPNVRFW